jgi:CubicO group peptidase (beta-lactamase class C family)
MKRPFRFFFALPTAILLISGIAWAQSLQSKMNEYMQASVRVNHFMGSILVARHGKILLARGYGMANLKSHIANTPDTEFRIASITKEFTAMAILQLEAKGKLNVQDPICEYVPNCPEDWHPIKIFNLLTHTSGIPEYTPYPGIETELTPPENLLALFKNKPLDFRPGTQFRYSSAGYEVLGYIIQRISGETYQQFLRQNIFGPLRMKDSGYDSSHPTAKNHAKGYVYSDGGYQRAQYVDMGYSAGALYSTVEDLYTWDRALEAGKLLPKPLLNEMFTPQGPDQSRYGFGWFISTEFGHKKYWHGGGGYGFTSINSWFPDQHAYVIVLDNMQSPVVDTVARELAAIVFGQEYELPKVHKAITLSPQELQKFVGQYQPRPHLVFTVRLAGDQLTVQGTGQPSFPMFPESKTEFFLKVMDSQISFLSDAEGKVTGLIVHQGGGDLPGKKIK